MRRDCNLLYKSIKCAEDSLQAMYCNAGWYLYIETSKPRRPGDRARVLTPLLRGNPDVARCLRFSYDMYGSTIGFLNVYVDASLRRNHTFDAVKSDGVESAVSTKPMVYLYGTGVQTVEEDKKREM